MTYVPNIPQAQLSPAATQAQIQTNFAQYATVFAVNHTPLNNSNQGDHEEVILELQANDPGVIQDLVALYCKNAPSQLGAQPQLFAQIKEFLPTSLDTTTTPNTPMQITYNQVNTSGPQYQSFLVGGLLVFFGSTNSIVAPITLSPSPSSLQIAIAIPILASATVNTTITQPNQFKINTFSGVGTYFWIAIGAA